MYALPNDFFLKTPKEQKVIVDSLTGMNSEGFDFLGFLKQSAVENMSEITARYESGSAIFVLGKVTSVELLNHRTEPQWEYIFTPIKFYGKYNIETDNLKEAINTLKYVSNYSLDSTSIFLLQVESRKKKSKYPFIIDSIWDLEWTEEEYKAILDGNYHNILCEFVEGVNRLRTLRKSIDDFETIKKQHSDEVDQLHESLKREKESIEVEIKKLEEGKKDTIASMIAEAREQEEKNNKIIEDKNKEIEELENTINDLDQRIVNIKKEELSLIEQYRSFKDTLEMYGMRFSINEIDRELYESENLINPILMFDELTKKVVDYLKYNMSLDYCNDKTRIIDRFLSSLLTNQIIILEGPPGTGKSTLPRAIAEALSAEFVMIPVQPNWLDKSDLFGFYHYSEHRFIPTLFTETLLKAQQNPSKLYIVCLDEMNLSHIEYYLADILSAMEGEKDNERLIELYPLREFNYTIDLINAKKLDEGERIQSKLYLPKNVQIVGTLNMDFTTKFISPKVLDRSYLIKLDYSTVDKIDEIISDQDFLPVKYNPEIEFRVENEIFEQYIVSVDKILNKINEYSEKKYQLNQRIKKQIQGMIKIDNEYILSDIILGKILPRVYIDKGLDNLLNEMYTVINGDWLSEPAFKNIRLDDSVRSFVEKYTREGVFDYWR